MGRPRRYDENELLEAAQELFWTRGYDRTSVEDIAAASGVATSSLYATHGSKRDLFLQVFRRYCAGRVDVVADAVSDSTDDGDELLAIFLRRVVDDCVSYPDRRGCLMLTSLTELRERFPEVVEISTVTIAAMEEAVATALAHTAHRAGRRLHARDVAARAEQAVLASQAVIHLSRLPLPRPRLLAMGEALLRS